MSPLPLHRRDDSYSGLIPLLTGLFGALLFICLVGLVWCFVRRKKHRAPIIPYHLHTMSPRPAEDPKLAGDPATKGNPTTSEQEVEVEVPVIQEPGKVKRKSKRPPPLGQEGRGIGYGFNPVLGEAYGGGGGLESGEGVYSAQRVGPMWG
ncbi:hypothetical protein MMC10_003435 [Thelotrema lepadinum]|nr:hypothetical protein [Thelotrema lepadinum]